MEVKNLPKKYRDFLKRPFGELIYSSSPSLDEINSIIKMKDYFESFGIELIFNMYNKKNYVMKPYIYDNPVLYNKSKKISEFYYEIPVSLEKEMFVYRIAFEL